MSVIIRPISLADAAAYRDALGRVARERRYILMTDAPPLKQCVSFVRDNLEQSNAHYVVLDKGQVIGWADIVASTRVTTQHVGGLGMGLVEGYRGQGIGSSLLTKAVEHAFGQGLTRIELEVFSDNPRALALYEKHGFVREGVKRRARQLDGVYQDIVLMAQVRV